MDSPAQPLAVVVGAGFTGLLAARRLAQAGLAVTVVEGSSRRGGQIRTLRLGGRPIDVGAEAMHLGVPAVGRLIDELGLRATMVTARRGVTWLAIGRRLRRLPEGVGPAGPTRLGPVLDSRVLNLVGLGRAAAEPAKARVGRRLALGPGHDVSVGDFVTARFGAQVTDRLVDPLLGSLHAGDVRELSLRACAPSLLPAASEGRSLARRPRSARSAAGRASGPAMSFVSWPDGLSVVLDALADGVTTTTRLGAAVTRLTREVGQGGPAYRLTLADGDELHADAVVLAIPAPAAAALLRPVAPQAAAGLDQIRFANVATVVVGYPRALVDEVPALRGNGLLVPSTAGTLLKAATFLSSKWPHLRADDTTYLRLSAGRAGADALAGLDDAQLLDHLRRDLRAFIGLDVHPTLTHIERWPGSMPQLTVGHPDRLAAVRAALSDLPAVALAGASYDGIGLSSCIGSATAAACLVAETIRERRA